MGSVLEATVGMELHTRRPPVAFIVAGWRGFDYCCCVSLVRCLFHLKHHYCLPVCLALLLVRAFVFFLFTSSGSIVDLFCLVWYLVRAFVSLPCGVRFSYSWFPLKASIVYPLLLPSLWWGRLFYCKRPDYPAPRDLYDTTLTFLTQVLYSHKTLIFSIFLVLGSEF